MKASASCAANRSGSQRNTAARSGIALDYMIRKHAKKQAITITVGGKGEYVSPESLVEVMDGVLKLLKSVDSHMWPVGAPRYYWRVTAVSMKSPLTIRWEATPTLEDSPPAPVAQTVVDGIKALEKGKRRLPRYFRPDDLVQVHRIVKTYGNSVGNIRLEASGRKVVSPSTKAGRTALEVRESVLLPEPYEAYGSVEGILRRVTVDRREGHEASDLQLIERDSEQIVDCRLSPELAERMKHHLARRVILFGTVRYEGSHVPQRIKVEDFRAIEEEPLPTLEEIHKLGVNITGGEDAADFVSRLRGEDVE